MKKQREDNWKSNNVEKQKTGIVRNGNLKIDYDNRKTDIEKMTEQINELKKHHDHLTKIISRANKLKMSNYDYAET